MRPARKWAGAPPRTPALAAPGFDGAIQARATSFRRDADPGPSGERCGLCPQTPPGLKARRRAGPGVGWCRPRKARYVTHDGGGTGGPGGTPPGKLGEERGPRRVFAGAGAAGGVRPWGVAALAAGRALFASVGNHAGTAGVACARGGAWSPGPCACVHGVGLTLGSRRARVARFFLPLDALCETCAGSVPVRHDYGAIMTPGSASSAQRCRWGSGRRAIGYRGGRLSGVGPRWSTRPGGPPVGTGSGSARYSGLGCCTWST